MNLEDMLGGAPAPVDPFAKKPGRPSKETIAARERHEAEQAEMRRLELREDSESRRLIRAAAGGNTLINAREFFMPVGQNFFAHVLSLNPETVRKRLRRVAPVGYSDGAQKRPLYDFRLALPHLIKSDMDAQTLLETINPNDMPNSINKSYWEAKRLKLKYEIEAGQAWSTEDVLEVFGTVFMAIKDRTKLWVDDLREQCKGMSVDEIFGALQEHVDAYQVALHSDLIEIPKQRQTRSKIAETEMESLPAYEDDGE